ncbi:MAG TPA: hypothetical protein VK638_49665 [Edaphobacter sp.]|nr:hypothetical protein [Edaphobacter sp.]
MTGTLATFSTSVRSLLGRKDVSQEPPPFGLQHRQEATNMWSAIREAAGKTAKQRTSTDLLSEPQIAALFHNRISGKSQS